MPLKDAPQYNKQHAVPQNIMDVEFKLIGELTMRQFFYVLIFFGLAYGVFNVGIPVIFKWPLIGVLVFAGLGFAFLPVEDRGLDEWIVNFFKAIFEDSQRIWHKEPTPPSAFMYKNISAIQHELITLTPTASRRKLEQYLEDQYTAKSTDPYDILEESYIMKVKQAYAGTQVVAPPKPIPTVTIEEAPAPAPAQPQPIQPLRSQPSKPVVAKPLSTPKPKVEIPTTEDIFIEPLTPDRHAGRRFTSLLPSQGTIVLPIRGERTLRPTAEQQPSADTAEKAKQLKALIEQIKGTEKTHRAEATKVSEEAEKLIMKLQAENEDLQKQIAALQGQPAKENEIKALEEKQKETVITIGKLKEQVSTLGSTPEPETETSQLGVIPPSLQSEIPNTIAGIVRNIQGRGLKGVLLVIKNNRGEPVRAIKTNGLGEFSISNPLITGKYTLEADVNGTTGFRFDIIDFDAKGEIIPAMEIVGH